MKNLMVLFFGLLMIGCEGVSKTNQNELSNLGEVKIEVSGEANAIPVFKEGLLLLHSFEYKDAAEKFRQAQEIDTSFGMAYWGEAMTQNHSLWREQELDDARDVLKKLGETKEKQAAYFKTELEKDFFESISILYGEGTKKERDIAYSNFLAELHEKYPENQEIASFYALSLLGASKGRDKDAYEKGARIAQSVIAENPNHPGALHYLIHSYDDPINAKKALTAANSYSNVAPDAGHALHMPSHIYVAMGMWDEVISSNEASWEASINRQKRKDLSTDALNFHALKWLMYGHLQKEEFEEAKKLVEMMEGYCYAEQSPKAVSHNVMMKAAYFAETNDWENNLLFDTIDYSDLGVQIMGAQSYVYAMHALNNNKLADLQSIITKLENKINSTANDVLTGTASMCSGSYSRARPTQTHIDRARVVLLELKSLVAGEENKIEDQEALLKEAIEIEEATNFMYGPPEVVKPSHEMYAEWLLTQKRYKEAKKHFQKVLERAPNRLIAKQGIEKLKHLS